MGNDQNEQTGLYGATGAMRVWSGIFSRLPSAPLKVSGKGLDWQWVSGANTTDASCPGARQIPFVAGFAPEYAPCVIEPMPDETEEEGGGWRSWFGLDKKPEEQSEPPPEPAPTPEP
jgi:penicillin-binding protein 1B